MPEATPFQIDLDSAAIRLRGERLPFARKELVILFRSKNARFHLGVMALVAEEHKKANAFEFVAIVSKAAHVHQLAEAPVRLGGRRLSDPYGAARQFWRRNIDLASRRYEVRAAGATLRHIPTAVMQAFTTLLQETVTVSQGVSLRFNPEAMRSLGVSPADFSYKDTGGLLARMRTTRSAEEASQKGTTQANALTISATSTQPVAPPSGVPSGERRGPRAQSPDSESTLASQATTISTAPSKGSLYSGPEFWVDRAIEDLLVIPEFDIRQTLLLYVASIAASPDRINGRDRLVSDFTNHVLEQPDSDKSKAERLLRLASWHVSVGNDFAALRVIDHLLRCPKAALTDLDIWPVTRQGVFNVLLPDLAGRLVANNEVKLANKALARLRRYAEQCIEHSRASKSWEPSRAYIDLKSRMGAVQDACAHFAWMCVHPDPSDRDYYRPSRCIVTALLAQEKWADAVDFLERNAERLGGGEEKSDAWVSFLWRSLGQLPLPQVERVIDHIKGYAGQESNGWKRTYIWTQLGRILGRLNRLAEFTESIREAVGLLEDLLKNRAGEEGHNISDMRDRELHVRVGLARAYLESGNGAPLNKQLAHIMRLHAQLIKHGCNRTSIVAPLLIHCGRIKTAAELALGTCQPLLGSKVLPALVKAKEFQKLHDVYEQMVTSIDKLQFFFEVFTGFQDTG